VAMRLPEHSRPTTTPPHRRLAASVRPLANYGLPDDAPTASR
jgi:hypothetical protein